MNINEAKHEILTCSYIVLASRPLSDFKDSKLVHIEMMLILTKLRQPKWLSKHRVSRITFV